MRNIDHFDKLDRLLNLHRVNTVQTWPFWHNFEIFTDLLGCDFKNPLPVRLGLRTNIFQKDNASPTVPFSFGLKLYDDKRIFLGNDSKETAEPEGTKGSPMTLLSGK